MEAKRGKNEAKLAPSRPLDSVRRPVEVDTGNEGRPVDTIHSTVRHYSPMNSKKIFKIFFFSNFFFIYNFLTTKFYKVLTKQLSNQVKI